VAIAGTRELGLVGILQILIPLLAGGATAVICPVADAPSALLALAELSGRCGFPDGVLNIVYGDQVLIEQIRCQSDLHFLS
jgi:acyl-CoA reductase-like NAD-dependent aldehyde dehydrogenase